MALWIILGIIVVLIIAVIAMYNSLVTLRQRVKNAWSQIDVQLQRRFDLIPNLVETVKGYMEHEKEVLQQSEKGNMRLVDEMRRRSLNEVIAEAELKAKRRKKMDEIKKTRKMTEHHMER